MRKWRYEKLNFPRVIEIENLPATIQTQTQILELKNQSVFLITVLGCLNYNWPIPSDVEHFMCLLASCLYCEFYQLSLAIFT